MAKRGRPKGSVNRPLNAELEEVINDGYGKVEWKAGDDYLTVPIRIRVIVQLKVEK